MVVQQHDLLQIFSSLDDRAATRFCSLDDRAATRFCSLDDRVATRFF